MRPEGDLCYWLTPGRSAYQEAKEVCQQDGGDLVVIQSENETLIVQELLKQESVTQAWIGLREIFTSWKWISGQ